MFWLHEFMDALSAKLFPVPVVSDSSSTDAAA